MRLVLLLMVVVLSSCATTDALSRRYPILAFEHRIYVTCPKEWVAVPLGKVCFRQCVKAKLFSRKCTEWFLDIRDLSDLGDFDKFELFEFRRPRVY